MTKAKRTTKLIRAADLHVNFEVQRRTDPRHAGKIADNFDPAGLGVLEVSEHADGSWWVMDGAHRLAAVMLRGEGDRHLLCNVHHGLTLAQEAKAFSLLNSFKQPQYIDRFRIRVKAGEPQATHVARIIENAGWKVDFAPLDGHLQAVKACEDVFTGAVAHGFKGGAYPEALAWTLNIITAAWGYANPGSHGAIIQGLGKVFFRDHENIDTGRLAKKLGPFPGGPEALRGAAHGVRSVFGGSIPDGVAGVIVETYNKGARVSLLEPWRISR